MQLDVFVMSFFALRFERKIPDPKKKISLQNVKLALSLIQWRLEQLLLHLREKKGLVLLTCLKKLDVEI